MSEKIIINIVRPEVGFEYHPASREAEPADQLAACELALHALAQRVVHIRTVLGLPCPDVVTRLVDSDIWRQGL